MCDGEDGNVCRVQAPGGEYYWWDTRTNLVAYHREALLQLMKQMEVGKLSRQWVHGFVRNCLIKAAAVRELGWHKVLALDAARLYVWRLTTGLGAYLHAAEREELAFQQERTDAEKRALERVRTRKCVCVELNTLAGESLSFVLNRMDNIEDILRQTVKLQRGRTSASSADTQVTAHIVYPGTMVSVPPSICLDAFWEGRLDSWFAKYGVDMGKVRDHDGTLHFDVVVGAMTMDGDGTH